MEALIIFAAQYLYIVVVASVIACWLVMPRPYRPRFLLQVALALVLAFALAKALGALWYDPRPFVLEGITPLFPHAADNGLPSEHTTYTMTLALVVLIWSWRWGIPLFALAGLVAWGRVASHMHSIPQVLAGVTVAVIAVVVGYGLAQLVYRLWRKRGSHKYVLLSNKREHRSKV